VILDEEEKGKARGRTLVKVANAFFIIIINWNLTHYSKSLNQMNRSSSILKLCAYILTSSNIIDQLHTEDGSKKIREDAWSRQ
jgi:hypothetical protein